MGTVRCHPNLHGVTRRRSLLSSEMDEYPASAEHQHAPTTRIIFPSSTEPFIHCIDASIEGRLWTNVPIDRGGTRRTVTVFAQCTVFSYAVRM